jgi:hypothetical protein
MHDAGLDGGLRKRRVDGIREALEAVPRTAGHVLTCTRVDDRDEDVFDAPVAQIIHHRGPEFSSFGVGDLLAGRRILEFAVRPQTQNLTFALRGDAQGHINRLVFDLTAFRVADFDP